METIQNYADKVKDKKLVNTLIQGLVLISLMISNLPGYYTYDMPSQLSTPIKVYYNIEESSFHNLYLCYQMAAAFGGVCSVFIVAFSRLDVTMMIANTNLSLSIMVGIASVYFSSYSLLCLSRVLIGLNTSFIFIC